MPLPSEPIEVDLRGGEAMEQTSARVLVGEWSTAVGVAVQAGVGVGVQDPMWRAADELAGRDDLVKVGG